MKMINKSFLMIVLCVKLLIVCLYLLFKYIARYIGITMTIFFKPLSLTKIDYDDVYYDLCSDCRYLSFLIRRWKIEKRL